MVASASDAVQTTPITAVERVRMVSVLPLTSATCTPWSIDRVPWWLLRRFTVRVTKKGEFTQVSCRGLGKGVSGAECEWGGLHRGVC